MSTLALPLRAARPFPVPLAPAAAAHIPALDGIRGLAILLVMLHHFFATVHVDSPTASHLLHALQSGWIGVDLFFVLSGYLITGILYDSRSTPHFFRNFFARRALRIFPLYFAVLLLTLLLAPWIMPAQSGPAGLRHHFPWLFVYLQNVVLSLTGDWHAFEGAGANFIHFWSLAVEEHFYLAWPFAVAFLSRTSLLRLAAIGILLALVARLLIAMLQSGNLLALYTLTPCRMDSLLIGAGVALLARSPAGLEPLARSAELLASLGLPLLLAAIVLFRELPRTTSLLGTLLYPALALLFAATLVHTLLVDGRMRACFSSPALRFLGKYSYALYIFHGCLEKPFALARSRGWFTLPNAPLATSLLCIAAWFAASLLLSLLSYRLLERPCLSLKRHFA